LARSRREPGKVVFGFFILLAATLNFGFFIGDIGVAAYHDVYELFAALVVSLIATILKLGDRTQIGAVHLATSLVADLQLITAAIVWAYAGTCHRGRPHAGDGCAYRLALGQGLARQPRVGHHSRGRDADATPLSPPP